MKGFIDPNIVDFHKNNSPAERQNISDKLLRKYPDRVPILLCKGDANAPNLEKFKYLVPIDATFSKFISEVRSQLVGGFNQSTALMFFINDRLIPISANIGTLYCKNKNEDGFLYIHYATENVFGDNL